MARAQGQPVLLSSHPQSSHTRSEAVGNGDVEEKSCAHGQGTCTEQRGQERGLGGLTDASLMLSAVLTPLFHYRW